MSRPKASTRVDKQKIIAAIVLLLIVGYVVGRPTFERWLGQSLPTFGLDGNEEPAAQTDRGPDRPPTNPGSDRSGSASDRDTDRRAQQGGNNDQPEEGFFQPAGGRRLRSPAGLIYGVGPGGEHRCDHVREHATDDPSRPVHGVFEGTGDEVFALIDEAWRLAQKGGQGVQKNDSDDGRVEYTVRLNRSIGFEGGQQGRRNDFPKLNRIKLIIEDDNELVTAYPVR